MYWILIQSLLVAIPACSAMINNTLNTLEFIRSAGYPVEIHKVTTEDGYILTLFRIPAGRNEQYYNGIKGSKRIIFIPHPLSGSSAVFISLGSGKSFAYMLADAGYDVWMMNGRGVSGTQLHVTLSAKSDEYWKFGWHEIAVIDVPTSIDYILELTGECQVDYIGLSLAATYFYALADEKPEYNDKIRSMIGLGPIGYVTHSPALVWSLSPLRERLSKILANLRTLAVPPLEARANEFMILICDPKNTAIYGPVCDILLKNLNAFSKNIERKNLPLFFKIFPDFVSLRLLMHLLQIRKTGRFEKYNFGKKINYKKYGTPYPPLYNLSRISTPISYIWGDKDEWASTKDVLRIMEEHKNIAFTKMIPNYTHFDLFWGTSAPVMVYNTVLEWLKMT